jgi:hypothetical protein
MTTIKQTGDANVVRIIERASTKQCTCSRCKCKLEYEYNDMHFSLHRDYGGGSARIAVVVCPNCQNQTRVSVIF